MLRAMGSELRAASFEQAESEDCPPFFKAGEKDRSESDKGRGSGGN